MPTTIVQPVAPHVHTIVLPVAPHVQTETFIITRTPDQLVKDVVSALYPTYALDEYHEHALRGIIHRAIVPYKPPSVDAVLSSLSSAEHRPPARSSRYSGVDDRPEKVQSAAQSNSAVGDLNRERRCGYGPPQSTTQAFYFHHTNSQFSKILPDVDRSLYTKSSSRKQSADQDTNYPSKIPTPPKKRASSPSLPSSPPGAAFLVEEDETYQTAHEKSEDIKAQGEEQLALDGTIDNDDMLSGDTTLVPDFDEPAVQTERSTSTEDANEDDSGLVEDTEMGDADNSVNGELFASPLHARKYPLDPPATQDTIDSMQQDSIFSQQEPMTQVTDPTPDTQPTDTQTQDHANTKKPRAAKLRKSADPKPRRSLRLAKIPPLPSASAPSLAPSAPSTLGKRSRASGGSQDELARKRSKA